MAKRHLIGCSGWSYEHWKGRFYPEDLAKRHWFDYYARRFDTVEVNYTFYHWPRESTLRKWYRTSPSDFKYTLKAPRFITHLRKLKGVEDDVRRLYQLGSLLGEKMGCYLFQLPPFYGRTSHNLEKLKVFLGLLDGRRNNVMEFRDPDWWDNDTYRLLNEHHVSFCTVSGLDMPRDVVATSGLGYVRFHGRRYSTRYSEEEIAEYADKIREMDASKVYVYFNNDDHAFAVENARELKEGLEDAR